MSENQTTTQTLRLSRRSLLLGISGLALSAGAVGSSRLFGQSEPGVAQAIADAVGFLTRPIGSEPSGQYNPTLGLLREAPAAAPCKYWLFNDNALAAHALRAVGNPLGDSIWSTVGAWGFDHNGLHEVLWGVPFGDSPDRLPRTHRYLCLQPAGEGNLCEVPCAAPETTAVCMDVRDGNPMGDWQQYADLAFYAALNRRLLGDLNGARAAFNRALEDMDWTKVGFTDLPYNTEAGFETYKVALALHTGIIMGELSSEQRRMLVSCLLARQDTGTPGKAGGFYTHYLGTGGSSDVNTETTSLVLLALKSYLEVPRFYLPFVIK